jgi:hypothetical protein
MIIAVRAHNRGKVVRSYSTYNRRFFVCGNHSTSSGVSWFVGDISKIKVFVEWWLIP